LYKIILISFFGILGTGCSFIKMKTSTNSKDTYGKPSSNILENVKKRNISSKSFFIEKAEIKILKGGETKRFLCSLKFQSPNKYLISLKSITGLEVARIFVSEDSIFVNDRINKKYFYGSNVYLEEKFGVTAAYLPIILGDYIDSNKLNTDFIKCKEGILDVEGVINGKRIKYVIECGKMKNILTVYEYIPYGKKIKIKFDNFLKNEDFLTPGEIEITDLFELEKVKISIIKICRNWEENIEFYKGSKYQIIRLL
jgi:hypothetical protein